MQIRSSESATRRDMAKGIRTAEARGHLPRAMLKLRGTRQVYQFCIAGLQESSPEDNPNQNAPKLLVAKALPQTTSGELTVLPQTPTWLVGVYRPSQLPKSPRPAQPFGLRARHARTMLISFRRHWRWRVVITGVETCLWSTRYDLDHGILYSSNWSGPMAWFVKQLRQAEFPVAAI